MASKWTQSRLRRIARRRADESLTISTSMFNFRKGPEDYHFATLGKRFLASGRTEAVAMARAMTRLNEEAAHLVAFGKDLAEP